jgi:hypothetical protein
LLLVCILTMGSLSLLHLGISELLKKWRLS